MRIVILFFSLLLAFSVQAALYKWTDENGEVVYSDEPPHEGAEEMKPPTISTTPAIKYKPKPPAKADGQANSKPTPSLSYETFKITSPADDEAVRNNPGNVSITLALEPALRSTDGHYVNLLVDGKPTVTKSQVLTITIENMDRGTHTLIAEVCDAEGKVLISSNPITFHLLRYSKLLKNKAP